MCMQMSTSISLNLNFVLYIRNLSLSDENNENSIFPWIPINKDIFLNPDKFNIEAENLWDNIFANCIDESVDSIEWNEDKYDFSKLFCSKEDAKINLPVIKKCYLSWFRDNWKFLAELYLTNVIKQYYDLISEYYKKHKLVVAQSNITFKFIYTAPPIGWKWYDCNSIILSPKTNIINRNEIIDKLEQLCFKTGF